LSASNRFTRDAWSAGSRPIARPVDLDLCSARNQVRAECDQAVQRPPRQQHARGAAQQGEEHALGDELSHHLAPAGPEGEARRDLTTPPGEPGELQVGDVRARNQEHATDGAEEQQIALSLRPDGVVQQRHDLDL
jgi:hypothetical protein